MPVSSFLDTCWIRRFSARASLRGSACFSSSSNFSRSKEKFGTFVDFNTGFNTPIDLISAADLEHRSIALLALWKTRDLFTLCSTLERRGTKLKWKDRENPSPGGLNNRRVEEEWRSMDDVTRAFEIFVAMLIVTWTTVVLLKPIIYLLRESKQKKKKERKKRMRVERIEAGITLLRFHDNVNLFICLLPHSRC